MVAGSSGADDLFHTERTKRTQLLGVYNDLEGINNPRNLLTSLSDLITLEK